MIVNNYRALQFMREEMGETLTPADGPGAPPDRHRRHPATIPPPRVACNSPAKTRVAVFDRDDGDPIHSPPPAEQLPERMRLLCDFANEGEDGEQFVHPVVRAILLHFWLAYDHPVRGRQRADGADSLLLV